MFDWVKSQFDRTLAVENYKFGEIPRKRGNLRKWTAWGFIAIFFVHFVFTLTSLNQQSNLQKKSLNQSAPNDDFSDKYIYFFCLLISICTAFIGKLFLCICVFIEEVSHLRSRHNNKLGEAIKSCFQVFFTKQAVVGTFITIFIVVSLMIIFKVDYPPFHQTFISSVGVVMITNYLFDFKALSAAELSEVHESSNTNVAQGLAWNYFTSYLKRVLKKLPTTIRNDQRWNEEMENDKLQSKLFAIVPLNCRIPDKIGDWQEKHRGITFDSSLAPLPLNVGGVVGRTYQHSVYKISNDDDQLECYAILQYVASIETLHKMHEHLQMDKTTREEQCRLFVRIVEELIENDDDCRGNCLIVTVSGEEEDGALLRDALLEKIRGKKETAVYIAN